MTGLLHYYELIHWDQIQWFSWLAIIFVLLLLLSRLGLLKPSSLIHVPFNLGRKVFRHSMPQILQSIGKSSSESGQKLSQWLKWLGPSLIFVLAAATLAQPYMQGQRLPDPIPHREVIFIIDTSISMGLRDYEVEGKRVDRMTMVKNVMHYFLEQLQGNRIGLITFSESAYAMSPLTNDYGLLARQIDRLEPAILTGRTTDVSYGLMYALKHLQDNKLDTVEQKPALVLLSDVKRPSRDISPLLVAQQFKHKGYTLHTIAIGSGDKESRQSNGMELIYQPASFSLLSDIAEAGGGRFFIANNIESLKQAVLNIQEAERRQVEQAPRFVQLSLYYWPLALLLGLIMLMQLWRVVRS